MILAIRHLAASQPTVKKTVRRSMQPKWQNAGDRFPKPLGLGNSATINHQLHSLKLTAKAPENRPKPKRKGLYSNHPFSGAKMLVSGRVTISLIIGFGKHCGQAIKIHVNQNVCESWTSWCFQAIRKMFDVFVNLDHFAR